jgi:hypothetical protein
MSLIENENAQAKRAWDTNAAFWDERMGDVSEARINAPHKITRDKRFGDEMYFPDGGRDPRNVIWPVAGHEQHRYFRMNLLKALEKLRPRTCPAWRHQAAQVPVPPSPDRRATR